MVKELKRQISFPTISIGLLELLLFCSVFLATGSIGLDSGVPPMILPMAVFACVMMFAMVVSGVYRSDISRSIIRLYQRTAVGFGVGAVGLLLLGVVSTSVFFDLKFILFVLAFSYFVVSTIRPLIIDTFSVDQGDRRSQ